ncbi:MAG TPA: hypothetical protein PLB81_01915, partial [Deltaproteobacteria bacterium]|nr:hypothetical protein [Deltaproteobacteria bacterium]
APPQSPNSRFLSFAVEDGFEVRETVLCYGLDLEAPAYTQGGFMEERIHIRHRDILPRDHAVDGSLDELFGIFCGLLPHISLPMQPVAARLWA